MTTMARQERIHFPGAFYHVMLRGNAGKQLFYTESDRSRFCFLLQEGIERFSHSIHAFCLMSNHVHLLVQAGENSISKAMQNVAFRYSRYLNKKHNIMGHQFQGRYKCLLVQQDNYLLQVMKYIHLNPVKAMMVKSPDLYFWSSHNAYRGKDKIPWIKTDFLLGMLSNVSEKSHRNYLRFVLETPYEDEFEAIEKPKGEGRIVGDEIFVKEVYRQRSGFRKVESKLTLDQVLCEVAASCDMEINDILCESKKRKNALARSLAAYYCNELTHLTLTELAKLCGRQVSTLSEQANSIKMKMKMKRCEEIAMKIRTINHKLGLSEH